MTLVPRSVMTPIIRKNWPTARIPAPPHGAPRPDVMSPVLQTCSMGNLSVGQALAGACAASGKLRFWWNPNRRSQSRLHLHRHRQLVPPERLVQSGVHDALVVLELGDQDAVGVEVVDVGPGERAVVAGDA